MSRMDSELLSELQESTPVGDAARRVLSVRLEVVRDCLGRALAEGQDRRRSIHALRVSTRRAAAAIDVFESCLPRRVFKDVRRAMRTLRRAVGAARDWDVMLHHLAKAIASATADERPVLDMLRGYALAHRLPAQRRLGLACPDHPFGFDRLMARCVAAVRQRASGPASFGGHLQPIVGRRLRELAERCADGDGAWDRLHEVRIAGKRLRYTLELAPDSFAAPLLARLCPALARLQEILGEVNDSFNATQMLRALVAGMADSAPEAAESYAGILEAKADGHETVMQRGREAFRGWLRDWQSAEMQDAIASVWPHVRGRWPAWPGAVASPPDDPAMLLGRTA